MDYEFSSQEELFKRVKPALSSKKSELDKYGLWDILPIGNFFKYLR